MTARTVMSRLAWVGMAAALSACIPDPDAPPRQPRSTLVIGIDVSGSFKSTGNYADAIEFAAHYLHAHLSAYGELKQPSAVFVGSVGGERPGEAKSFQPISAFAGKSPQEIAAVLLDHYPSAEDGFTDFNAFFDRVSTLVKRQGLTLSPLNIILLSDGIPDVTRNSAGGAEARYANIDLGALEYLSRNVTVRLLYATATVSVAWERQIDRRRVRMWTVDDEVMRGWREHMDNNIPDESQERMWKWMLDNVDFRVRSRLL